jgi:GGDEF domain-containing protein
MEYASIAVVSTLTRVHEMMSFMDTETVEKTPRVPFLLSVGSCRRSLTRPRGKIEFVLWVCMYDERLASAILNVLYERFPDKLQVHDLKAALPQFSGVADQDWLRAIDALQAEDQIDGKFLRGGMANVLQAAAMLQITALGRKSRVRTASDGSVLRLDPLLKIPDQGAFEQDLPALSLAASPENPLSLVLVDIDHFKGVNDTYGHETGNEVLKQVASALVAVCKQKGTAYRIGGYESAVLLPNYSVAEAKCSRRGSGRASPECAGRTLLPK